MILVIDTIDPVIAIFFLLDKDLKIIAEEKHRLKNALSEKILSIIDNFLKSQKTNKKDLKAIAVNQGPGSYTGLRIGLATANALALSLNIPIVGFEQSGEAVEAMIEGLKAKLLAKGSDFDSFVVPLYKNPPHITKK